VSDWAKQNTRIAILDRMLTRSKKENPFVCVVPSSLKQRGTMKKDCSANSVPNQAEVHFERYKS